MSYEGELTGDEGYQHPPQRKYLVYSPPGCAQSWEECAGCCFEEQLNIILHILYILSTCAQKVINFPSHVYSFPQTLQIKIIIQSSVPCCLNTGDGLRANERWIIE